MKFELLGDFPRGQFIVPKGTVIDANQPEWRGVPMPMNTMALDQEAADYLATAYPFALHELRAVKGVTIRKLINI